MSKVTLDKLDIAGSNLANIIFGGYKKTPKNVQPLYVKLLNHFTRAKIEFLERHYNYSKNDLLRLRDAINNNFDSIYHIIKTPENDEYLMTALRRITYANDYDFSEIGFTMQIFNNEIRCDIGLKQDYRKFQTTVKFNDAGEVEFTVFNDERYNKTQIPIMLNYLKTDNQLIMELEILTAKLNSKVKPERNLTLYYTGYDDDLYRRGMLTYNEVNFPIKVERGKIFSDDSGKFTEMTANIIIFIDSTTHLTVQVQENMLTEEITFEPVTLNNKSEKIWNLLTADYELLSSVIYQITDLCKPSMNLHA